MKSVLITGVSGGIGLATAKQLKTDGWQVFGSDICECEIKDELSGFWQGDGTKEEYWIDLIVPGIRDVGLAGLVNNAAIQPCNSIANTSLNEWNNTMAVNLGAAFLATKYLFPLMDERGGSIVNISSVHAVATSSGMAAYVASKGGLLAFTRAAALELADVGIRVNAILPGAVDTQMLRAGLARHPAGIEDAESGLISKTPLRRLAQPADIAAAVSFLLDSEHSAFVTGQAFAIDGGALAQLSTE